MNTNFKIIIRSLFLAAMIILLIAVFLIKNGEQKMVLLYIAFGLGAGAFLQVALFLIKPGLFKNKTGNPD